MERSASWNRLAAYCNRQRRRCGVCAIWLLLFFLGSAAIGLRAIAYQTHLIEGRTSNQAAEFKEAVNLLQERLQKFRFGLEGIAGVYAVEANRPSLEQIRTYAESRGFFRNFAGVLGFGFIRSVPDRDLAAYLASQTKQAPEYKVRRLRSSPRAADSVSFLIEAIEPIEKNLPARGLDIASEINRYEAAVHAMNSGMITITQPVSLVQSDASDVGFLLFKPVYRTLKPLGTLSERRENIVGWTYAPVLMRSLLQSVAEQIEQQLAIRISDIGQAEPTILFGSKAWAKNLSSPGLATTISVFERPWRIEAHPIDPSWGPADAVLLYSTTTFAEILLALGLLAARRLISYLGKSEQKARTLEMWQAAIFDGADFGIITTDPAGKVTAISAGASTMFGYDSLEAVGILDFNVLHAGAPEPFTAEAGRAPLNKKLVRTFQRKDGRRFEGQLALKSILGDRQEVLGYLAIVEDITDRRRAEHDLQQMTLAINKSAIVATTDQDGVILDVNENFCAVSGYSRDEVIGKNHRLVNSGAHPKEFFQDLWTTVKGGKIWRGEIQNRRKDGSPYWVNSVITPLYSLEGSLNRFLSIRFDITQKKLTEAKLVRSAQLASLGEMSGGLSHEINNPLAMIKGKASVILMHLEKDPVDREKLKSDLEKINSVVDRIAGIVAGLRAFSREADLDVQRVESARKIVEDAVGLCQERFKAHGIDFRIGPIAELSFACRPVQVSQALLNLLTNAHDAVIPLEEKWVAVNVEQRDGSVRIVVTDSGTGIPAPVADKMMQPFYTTKDIGKGTGLGLSVAKGLIEAQGGRLSYDADSGHTRFVIELKATDAREQKKAA